LEGKAEASLINKDISDKKAICEVLRLLRISNDLSIKELSSKTGISASYITEIERGIKDTPSIDIIEKYSKALNVSKSTIMFFEEDLSSKKYNYQKMLLRILQKISVS
jgi:transcriptional regulator with XRE-family HTH domain